MASTSNFALLIFLVYGAESACGDCSNATRLATQLDLLLAEYERAAPPAAPVSVSAALEVRHATLDERDASVRMIATMFLSWEDGRLSWNASSWGCSSSTVSAERLWLPDVRPLSAVTADGGAASAPRARLSSRGGVIWPVPVDLVAPLTLSLRDWPRDEHRIVFKFGSRSHATDELKLTVDKNERSAVFESGAWELVSIKSEESTWRRLDSEESMLRWSLTLRRRAAAAWLVSGAVLWSSAALLAAAALMPPEARAPLCTVAALTASMWLISSLPRTGGSSSAPLLMSLMSVVSVSSAVLAAGAGAVLSVARRTTPPPPALRGLLAATSCPRALDADQSSGSGRGAWAALARLLDRVLICAVGLTLLVVLCLLP